MVDHDPMLDEEMNEPLAKPEEPPAVASKGCLGSLLLISVVLVGLLARLREMTT